MDQSTRKSAAAHEVERVSLGELIAVVLLFSLVVSGQIKLHRIDGWRKIAAVLSRRTVRAA